MSIDIKVSLSEVTFNPEFGSWPTAEFRLINQGELPAMPGRLPGFDNSGRNTTFVIFEC